MNSDSFPQPEFFGEESADFEDRSIPFSEDAEQAVLGSILINPDAFFDASALINEEDFYLRRHQLIWRAYSALIDARSPIDIQTIADILEKNDQLTEVGGKPFLYSLVTKTPTSMHAAAYAEMIAERSLRRRLISAAGKIGALAYDQKKPIDEVLGKSEQVVFDVSQKRSFKDVSPISQVVGKIYDQVRERYQSDEEFGGAPTGLRDLDKLLGGLQKSDLIIIAGRPGMGKTGFLLTVLKNVALGSRKNVAMFSLEMSNEQLVHRLIAQQTGINTQQLRTGKLNEDQLPGFVNAVDILGGANVFLDDTAAITPTQLLTKCRKLHLEHHLDLIIIDYLQLMNGDTGGDNRAQEISAISRNLKVLARELNVPVLTAAQLSREVEKRSDKIPQLSDLRESGSLEQDADIVMFLYKPESKGENVALDGAMKIIVAKHRNGPTADIDIVFLKKMARFVDAVRAPESGGGR